MWTIRDVSHHRLPEGCHNQIITSLPEGLASELDAMATRLKRSRADIVRHAIERYLDDLDDLEAAAERLRDPKDPMLDWDRASRELLDMG